MARLHKALYIKYKITKLQKNCWLKVKKVVLLWWKLKNSNIQGKDVQIDKYEKGYEEFQIEG